MKKSKTGPLITCGVKRKATLRRASRVGEWIWPSACWWVDVCVYPM